MNREQDAAAQKQKRQSAQTKQKMQEIRRIREHRHMQKQLRKIKHRLLLERCCFCLAIAALAFLYINEKVPSESASADAPSRWQPAVQEQKASLPETLARNNKEEISTDYLTKWELEAVEKPVRRTPTEVLEKLSALAEENSLIADILKKPELYPENLLEALANNPEMADFVKGYPRLAGTVSGELTQNEKEQEFPLFLQWDPRWGYAPYGDDSSIAVSGCGPVSLSMCLYYLTGDASLTPDKIASYSMENGYYVSGTGTAWALLTDVPLLYGIEVSQLTIDEYEMKQTLDAGNVLIASMRPGDFTAAGHFLVIYGYDKQGFLINDPNCIARSRKSWSFERLGEQIKNLWAFGNP